MNDAFPPFFSAPAPQHSIAGGWLGTYVYEDAGLSPTRFEATFTMNKPDGLPDGLPDGSFTGTILDDGRFGEARVENGHQSGRRVRFVKRYRASGRRRGGGGAPPINYVGTLSEDGRRVSGTWQIVSRLGGRPLRTRGTWEARRMWSAEAHPEQQAEADVHALAAARPRPSESSIPAIRDRCLRSTLGKVHQ